MDVGGGRYVLSEEAKDGARVGETGWQDQVTDEQSSGSDPGGVEC